METQDNRQTADFSLLAFAICICLIVIVIAAQSWWSVREDKSLTIAEAQRQQHFTIRILGEHANRALHGVTQILNTLSSEAAQSGKMQSLTESMQYVMARHGGETQFMASLLLLDAHGELLFAAQTTSRSAQIPDNNWRQKILFDQGPGVVFGEFRLQKESGTWFLPIAKKIVSTEGALLGVLVAEIRLHYFLDFYVALADAGSAIVSLHNQKAELLAISPRNTQSAEQTNQAHALTSTLQGAVADGHVVDFSIYGAQEKYLYTYHKLKDLPLTLVYARKLDDILTVWMDRQRQVTLFTSIIIIFIIVLALLLSWQLKRLQLSKARIDASENRYRLLFSAAQDAILLINREYTYVDCNPAAVRLFGVGSEADIIGKRAGSFSTKLQSIQGFTATDKDELVSLLVDRAFDGMPQRFEWSMDRNGKAYYYEITLNRVEIGGETMLFCVERDINDRKHSERLLEGQNWLLQLIGGNEDPLYVLDSVCNFIEQMQPQWCVGIQLLADDQRSFSQGVGHSFPEILLKQIIDLPISHGSGIWSEVVLAASPIYLDDLTHTSCMQFVNGLEDLREFRSGMAWPLMDKHGAVLGSLTLLLRNPSELDNEDLSLVSVMLEIASIAIEGRRSEKKILQLAHYDELTGLPNRFLYNQHLAKALLLAERNRSRLAVLFLDLDRFKNINDTFGHDEGDKVLRSVAQRFRHALRESDIVARIGGDEFILLIDQYHEPRDLGDIADKLLFEACQPFEIDGQECHLSASIGIAAYPGDGRDAQTLLKNADIAMYRAKNKGKDNYQFYASEMNTHTVERLAFEARLRKALERREFVVYYQPKISVSTGRVVGAEALVRWDHPERGILLPNDFIMLAEEAGLISRLGMLVLDIACRDVLSFRHLDKQFGRVAINLSASQFGDQHLLEDIKNVVDFWRVPSNAIEFEITESMVMHNREQAIVLMDGFKDAGFTLSIDDFGTGYSSLAYLKRFPVDSVKIDRSFIKDIPDDPNDTAIVQAIIVMARTLGLKVIAEGVDSPLQLDTLSEYQCDEYQGFYFSRAVPAREFQQLLQRQALHVLQA